MPFTMSFDIHIKWKFGYSTFVLYIHFFLDSSEFQVNQENIHSILPILEVVLALKEVKRLISKGISNIYLKPII